MFHKTHNNNRKLPSVTFFVVMELSSGGQWKGQMSNTAHTLTETIGKNLTVELLQRTVFAVGSPELRENVCMV